MPSKLDIEAIEIGASESQSSQTSRHLLFVQSAANDNVHVDDNQCLYTIYMPTFSILVATRPVEYTSCTNTLAPTQ